MPPRTGKTRLVAALLSTVGMVLSCPAYDLWWLGFVQWIPWFWAIEGATPKRAFLYGWLTGTLTVAWGFSWMSTLLTKFAGLPYVGALPLALIFAAWHGLIWGVPAALTVWIRRRTGYSVLWLTPLCWVAAEAFLPNLFPIYMALSWCWQPLWIQTAELGGVTTVSAVMVAINAGLYVLLREKLEHGRFDRRAAIVTGALLVGVPTYGAIRISMVEADMAEAEVLKFAVVQGNMSIFEMRGYKDGKPPRTREGRKERKLRVLGKQQALTAKLEQQGAQIALWGETSYPNARVFVRASVKDAPEGHSWQVKQGFSIPVIFGAVTKDHTGQEKFPFNTAILMDENSRIAGMYDKVYRLAFGEYAPLVPPEWYLEKFPNAAHIEKGDGAGVLQWNEWRLGPFICYEDILPRFVRDAARQKVHAFVNLTNAAWFGLTHEPAQHLGLAVFRTVEHRKGLVRAVNTGISVYIDPTGTSHDKTQVTDPDTQGPQDAVGFIAPVPMMDPDSLTLYGMTGEAFNVLCLLGVGFAATRRRREEEEPGSEEAEKAANKFMSIQKAYEDGDEESGAPDA